MYALFMDNDLHSAHVLIALKTNPDPSSQLVEVELIEAAPHNKFQNPHSKYRGVGKHLIAFVCKMSIELGFEGFIQLTSKMERIPYYIGLGATQIGNNHVLFFYDAAAQRLVTECQI